jgi:hypothetical protein
MMSSPRIRTSHAYGEVYPNVWSDFDWVHDHRKELLEKYGEGVVLVYQREVIGFGNTLDEAEEDAERRLPPDVTEVTPIIQYLRHRHPFFRIRPTLVPPEHD